MAASHECVVVWENPSGICAAEFLKATKLLKYHFLCFSVNNIF